MQSPLNVARIKRVLRFLACIIHDLAFLLRRWMTRKISPLCDIASPRDSPWLRQPRRLFIRLFTCKPISCIAVYRLVLTLGVGIKIGRFPVIKWPLLFSSPGFILWYAIQSKWCYFRYFYNRSQVIFAFFFRVWSSRSASIHVNALIP